MPIKTRELERMLTGKLAADVRQSGKHRWFRVWDGPQLVATTLLSHGVTEYSEDLLGRMSGQLKVSRKQLGQLVDCPMSRADYLAHLRSAEK